MLRSMNTSRMILVLLACFALQACGGGESEAPEARSARECPADLAGSFDVACSITVQVPTSGAAVVLAVGTLRIENETDLPQPYARTVHLSIAGGVFAPQMLHGVVPAHSGINVPFAVAQPIMAGMFPSAETLRVGLSSVDHGIGLASAVHSVSMSTY